MTRLRNLSPTLIALTVLLVLWELWVRLSDVPPTLIPAPTQIIHSTIRTWGTLAPASLVTALEGYVGFALAVLSGVGIGVALHVWRTANRAFFPLIYAAQTMPLISIAPLFLIWFGFEISGKIAIVAMFGLFPIAVQTTRGLDSVPRYYSDVALTSGAGATWTLWHVKLRVAARQIFSGIRISGAYTFATAVTAEYLGARDGLGIWLQAVYNSFQVPLVFSATLMIAVLTGSLLLLIHSAEWLILGPVEEETYDEEDGR